MVFVFTAHRDIANSCILTIINKLYIFKNTKKLFYEKNTKIDCIREIISRPWKRMNTIWEINEEKRNMKGQ